MKREFFETPKQNRMFMKAGSSTLNQSQFSEPVGIANYQQGNRPMKMKTQ